MEPWPLDACVCAEALLAAAAARPSAPTSFLLLGPSQSGKTCLAASFSRSIPCPLHLVTAGSLHHGHPGPLLWRGVLEALTDAARAALACPHRAAVLLFDDVDVLFPPDCGDFAALRAFALGLRRAAALPADGGATLWVLGASRGGVHEWASACLRGAHGAPPLVFGAPLPPLRGRMLVAAVRGAGLSLQEGADAAAVEALGAALGHGFLAGDVAAAAAAAADAAAGEAGEEGTLSSGEAMRGLVEAALRAHTPLLLAAAGADWGALAVGAEGAPVAALSRGGGDRGRDLRRALLAAGLPLPQAVVGVEDFRPLPLLEQLGGAVSVALRRGGGGAPPAPSRAPGSAASALGHFAAAARPTQPLCTWDSVVGQAEAKRALQALLRASAAAPAAGCGPSPCGILLYGPPGTGKTLLARAAAGALGCRFVNVAIPSVLKAGLGESEAALGAAFAVARLAAPALLFIDEVQALFTARGGGGGGGDDNAEKLAAALTAALLHCLDGAAAGCGVVVLAATNAPASLDDALFRPGRMDRVVHVGLPGREDRCALLGALLEPLALVEGGGGGGGDAPPPLAQLAEWLAGETEGFSGADCAALCRRAHSVALSQSGALDGFINVVLGGAVDPAGGEGVAGDDDDDESEVGALEVVSPAAPLVLTPAHFVAALRGDPNAGLMPMEPSVPAQLASALAAWRPRRQQPAV